VVSVVVEVVYVVVEVVPVVVELVPVVEVVSVVAGQQIAAAATQDFVVVAGWEYLVVVDLLAELTSAELVVAVAPFGQSHL